MAFELVIFDCDGVLVDTELIGIRIMAEMVRELGGDITDEEARHLFHGKAMPSHLAVIAERIGRPPPPDFESDLRSRWERAFRRELRPIEGVRAVLEQLDQPVCVVSNGPQEKMALTLGVTGLQGYFDGRIFSAYDIGKWKPEPDLYLYAAGQMDVEPAACAVVEDSVVGVQAAVAAGMTVFGFAANGYAAEMAAAGATVFDAMHALPALLETGRKQP